MILLAGRAVALAVVDAGRRGRGQTQTVPDEKNNIFGDLRVGFDRQVVLYDILRLLLPKIRI